MQFQKFFRRISLGRLPLLEKFSQRIKSDFPTLSFEKTHIVGLQHFVPTTAAMFEELHANFGLSYSKTWLTGKAYSTVHEVQKELAEKGIDISYPTTPHRIGAHEETILGDIQKVWANFLEDYKPGTPIIILDDGGALILSMPDSLNEENVVAIEQTTQGIEKLKKKSLRCPVVNVAQSGAKTLEAALIARMVLIQLEKNKAFNQPHLKYGVIGRGVIGDAIVRLLKEKGYTVYIHEQNAAKHVNNGSIYTELKNLFMHCDLILGCTAEDPFIGISIPELLNSVQHKLALVSCSSGDSQFGSIIPFLLSEDTPIKDVHADIISSRYPNIIILGGGFPINFCRTQYSDPVELFSFTRALLVAGMINAHELLSYEQQKKPNEILQLSRSMQTFIIETWIKLSPHARKIYSTLSNQDIAKIVATSEGRPMTYEFDQKINIDPFLSKNRELK